MIKIKKIDLLISKPFLAFLGFIFLSYYIWFRFIRERIPRDIPFDLTLISTIILIYICILYVYIILRIIKPKKPTTLFLYVKNFFYKMGLPFIILDEYLRKFLYKNLLIKALLEKNIIIIANILKNSKSFSLSDYINTIFMIFIYGPTLLFLLLFIIDLYNNKLNLIYKFIFIQIIPLFFMYYIYLLRLYVQNKINELSIHYMVEITSKDTDTSNFFIDISSISFDEDFTSFDGGYVEEPYPLLELQNFITLQINNIQFGIYDLYEYKSYVKDAFIENAEIKAKAHDFTFWTQVLVYNYVWIDIYTCSIYSKVRHQLSFKIYIITFLIWIYILFVSIHTFHFSDFEIIFLQSWQDTLDPFSKTTLHDK